MTSRTSPVGVVVLMLASLAAVGCSAQTSAVFEALLDPARAPASPSEADAATDGADGSAAGAAWWPHPDGYAMTLPAGWSGVATDRSDADRLIAAVNGAFPRVATRIEGVLGDTGSRVSGVAADLSAGEDVAPVLLVLAQPTDGKKARAVKARVEQQISDLPGIQGVPVRTDVRLRAANGVRFDYMVEDPDLGALRVSSYLFRFGHQAYLVSFIASESSFGESEGVFEAIANSLRFGV